MAEWVGGRKRRMTRYHEVLGWTGFPLHILSMLLCSRGDQKLMTYFLGKSREDLWIEEQRSVSTYPCSWFFSDSPECLHKVFTANIATKVTVPMSRCLCFTNPIMQCPNCIPINSVYWISRLQGWHQCRKIEFRSSNSMLSSENKIRLKAEKV